MPLKFIDLSGKKGLANRHQGNLNDTSATPNRIYLGTEGQFADGIFNPLKNYGYLSPVNNKYSAITGSINSRIIATEYDSINDDIYLAENGNTIWRLDGLSDTSLSSAVVIDQSATEAITDLEIYEINGKRNLFYAYNITDSNNYYSKIGILNLDSNSGVYEMTSYDENNKTIIDSIIASGTYQKLAQSVVPDQTEIPLTGSVDTSASTSVTGVGTLFTTELKVGDTIVVGTEKRVVATITNDTSLTVTSAFSDQSNDTAIKKNDAIRFDKIMIPVNRPSGDNGGYTLQVSIQDATNINTHSAEFTNCTFERFTAYITDAAQTGLDLTDDFSLECWVKFDDISEGSSTAQAFITKWGLSSSFQYFFGWDGGTDEVSVAHSLFLKIYDSASREAFVSWTPVVNTWYHVAVTRNKVGNEVKFYINGEQHGATQTISTSSIASGNSPFMLGAMTNLTTQGLRILQGKLDDVRVWSDVRTSTEILNNYRLQLVGNESNLVAYYNFNSVEDSTGNELYALLDLTSNNNDLTNNGEVTFSTDVPFGKTGYPDGTADASGTFNPTTVSTAFLEGSEKQCYIFVTLDSTIAKSQPFFIVLEPTVFSDMTSSDKVNWFGRTSDPETNAEALHYDGTYWTKTNSTYDNEEDFSYALILSSDQEWSNKRVTNPYNFKYNSDIFMTRADNGFMYVFEDNKVHKVDGTETGGASGTFTKEVLRFPSYFTTIDAVDTRGRMYIGVQANPSSGDEDVRTYSEGIVGVYTWDRQSAVVGARDFIPLYGVRDIKKLYIEPGGDVRAICIGDDRFVQIRSISSGYGKVIKTLGISAYPETRDGLKILNNMVIWLGADGIWYLHGKLSPEDIEELYKIGDITGEVTGAFTTGAIFIGNSEATQSRQAVLASFTDATPGSELLKWYPHGQGTISSVAQTGHIGNVYTQVVPLPAMSTVKNITINNFPTVSSGSTTIATIKIYFNQSTTPFKSHIVTQALANKGYVSIECNKPFVSSVQVEIEYSTSQTLGTDDFNPMFAVVDYDPPANSPK